VYRETFPQYQCPAKSAFANIHQHRAEKNVGSVNKEKEVLEIIKADWSITLVRLKSFGGTTIASISYSMLSNTLEGVSKVNDKLSFGPQDLRVKRSWEHFPPHLALPMLLMRESMKNSVFHSLSTKSTCDLSAPLKSPKPQKTSNDGSGFACPDCGRIYKLKSSLRNHRKWECGKEPQFKCPYCVYKAKQKMHMARHMERMHKEIDYASVRAEIEANADNTDSDPCSSILASRKTQNNEAKEAVGDIDK
ncbi:hypothetical protein ILUMI_10859, partial [Ignelater luminosus]